MRVLISCLLIGSITCYPWGKEYGENSADTGFMRPPFSSGFWYSGTGESSDPGSSLPSLPNPNSDKATVIAPQDVSAPEYGENSADTGFMRPPFSSGSWYSGTGVSSDAVSSSSLPSLPNPNSDKATVTAPQDVSAPENSANSADAGFMQPLGVWYGGAVLIAEPGSSPDVSSSNMAAGGYASFSDDRPEVSEHAVAYAGSDGSAPGGGYEGGSWSSGSATGYDAGEENPEPVFSDVSDLEPVYSFSSRSSYQRGRRVFAQTRYTPMEPAPQHLSGPRPISKTSKQSDPVKAPSKGGY